MSGGHLCEAEAPTEPAGETYPTLHSNHIGLIIIATQFRNSAGFHACIRSLVEGAVERSETEGVTPPVTRNTRDSPLKDGAE